ncbi:MAG: hypothetical protein V4581_01385 [Bacteroidota bacterium]
MEENKNPNINYFVRTLIVVLGVLISSLIISKFYFFDPKADISSGIIILISLLIILFLSEIFDSFSLGQFLSLKKTISEKNDKIQDLKESNDKLLNLVVNNNLSQRQTMTNVTGISPEEFAKTIISVIKADKDTTDKEETRKEKIAEIIVEEEEKNEPTQTLRKRINLPRLEKFVLERFLDIKDLKKFNFIEDAQILLPQRDLDPVSINNPIFDGYVQSENYEMFIEIKLRNSPLIMYRERLYLMLTKLYYYRLAKKSNAYLNLILVERPSNGEREVRNYESTLITEFDPAIRLGLLKIDYIELSGDDMEGLYRE